MCRASYLNLIFPSAESCYKLGVKLFLIDVSVLNDLNGHCASLWSCQHLGFEIAEDGEVKKDEFSKLISFLFKRQSYE